jgi:CRISPR-associated protein Cas1
VIKTEDFFFRKNSPQNYTDEKEMKANRPVEMKPAVCRAFIASYEEMMQRSINYPPLNKKLNYRWLILNQVRGFGKFLEKSSKTYEPFVWEI